MILENLTLYLRIIEKGGMAVAGREMGLSAATVSERLASLETYYGARLLTRTTRSFSLTDEGRMLAKGAKRLLAEAEEIEARIKLGVDKISGPICISAPIDLGRNHIAPMLDHFMVQNPDIKIDLILSDGYVDLVGQGIDLAIRLGALADSTLRAKTLGKNRRIVCASPKYLERFGRPEHPDDLSHHNCLLMRFGGMVDNEWVFNVKGRKQVCRVRGDRIINDGDMLGSWCRAGHGIGLKSIWDVQDDLASGALIEVLKAYAPAPTSLQLVYPSGAAQPRRIKALIEEISAKFA